MTEPSWRTQRLFLGGLGLALALLLAPVTAWANLARPSSGGQVVAEPVGIKDVEITRESLTIDLRPLALNGLAQVEAIYYLHNRGAEKTLDLLFASGSAGVADFRVWLGEKSVASKPAAGAPLPPSWRAPKETPGIHDEIGLEYLPGLGEERAAPGSSPITPVELTVVIPSGRHTLKVRYAAEAATHREHPTVYRQIRLCAGPGAGMGPFRGPGCHRTPARGLARGLYTPANPRRRHPQGNFRRSTRRRAGADRASTRGVGL
jgi:hypothetical protein